MHILMSLQCTSRRIHNPVQSFWDVIGRDTKRSRQKRIWRWQRTLKLVCLGVLFNLKPLQQLRHFKKPSVHQLFEVLELNGFFNAKRFIQTTWHELLTATGTWLKSLWKHKLLLVAFPSHIHVLLAVREAKNKQLNPRYGCSWVRFTLRVLEIFQGSPSTICTHTKVEALNHHRNSTPWLERQWEPWGTPKPTWIHKLCVKLLHTAEKYSFGFYEF